MGFVYQEVRLAALGVTLLALSGCGSRSRYVALPPFRGYDLSQLLGRLHDLGLRASFPAARATCGTGLPAALIQSPRPPARVKRGSTVMLKFGFSPIPSSSVPNHHARWTTVPRLVGEHPREASADLVAISPCFSLRPAVDTSATELVVVEQSPPAGARVRAFGVLSRRGYRPTTVRLVVAAR
jgi:hypothetical protein